MRYNRHIILDEIGQKGQNEISKAKVLVIGAGGLGCSILQYLVGAGVGTIGIIDYDKVELSNLQRQVLFGSSSLGRNKAIAAKERLEDLNDEITINAYPKALTYKNALQLFQEYDVIVDGSDNFETRYLVNDACIILNKPLVFGAIYKFEGQISVFNYNNGPSYRCLFPDKPQKNAVPNCSEIGVLGVLPGIIGCLQTNEVLKIILGLGDVLSGKVLCFNALVNNFSTLKVKRQDKIIQEILDNKDEFRNKSLEIDCLISINEISLLDILYQENIQIIDVRETHELPKIIDLDVTQIPLIGFEKSISKVDRLKKKIVFCQSGVRSKKAVRILMDYGFQNSYCLIEGAKTINEMIKNQTKKVLYER